VDGRIFGFAERCLTSSMSPK